MEQPKHAAFWMVWNPAGRAPTYKHDSFIGAEAEAKRLAQMVGGETFYVLQAICAAKRPDPVEVVKLFSQDEIPF